MSATSALTFGGDHGLFSKARNRFQHLGRWPRCWMKGLRCITSTSGCAHNPAERLVSASLRASGAGSGILVITREEPWSPLSRQASSTLLNGAGSKSRHGWCAETPRGGRKLPHAGASTAPTCAPRRTRPRGGDVETKKSSEPPGITVKDKVIGTTTREWKTTHQPAGHC